MALARSSGILLHPTSLPGPFGIGDLGPETLRFLDFLAGARQSLWQILPLGPTGYGDSPYSCFSAFAGNPLLLSPEGLEESGDLPPRALQQVPAFPEDRVDYGRVIGWKRELLGRSFEHFRRHASGGRRAEFEEFCRANGGWLEDFALFMALKDAHGGLPWNRWERPLVVREPEALRAARAQLCDAIAFHEYAQYQFARQWAAVRRAAHARGIRIVGDMPIFVALDSAEVWAHPEIFYLDSERRPTLVAGVPPDYFSETGQLWGNPLYRWDVLAASGYDWWIERFRAILALVDIVRIDHFRGFEGYWEVPATEKTAIRGRWVRGPGIALFRSVAAALGEVSVIAEDLGVITPDVVALREACGFPGMKVLQFAFSEGASHPYLPHNYEQNCVVYTGTHDNDTAAGWFASASAAERRALARYLGREASLETVPWDLARLAFASVGKAAILPLQDVLGLGSEARMNAPSTASGNWGWRFRRSQLVEAHRDRLAELAETYGRVPERS